MARVESDFDYLPNHLADGFPHLKRIISKFFFEVFIYPSNFTSLCTYVLMYFLAVLFFKRLLRKLIISDFPYNTSIWHTLNP